VFIGIMELFVDEESYFDSFSMAISEPLTDTFLSFYSFEYLFRMLLHSLFKMDFDRCFTFVDREWNGFNTSPSGFSN